MDKELMDKYLKFGVDKGASDIHFEIGGPPAYRVKGDLLKAKTAPLTPEQTLDMARILLGDRDVDLRTLFKEQDTNYSLPGVSRFRVSVFRQRGTIGCVLRVVPFEVASFEELNLPPILKEVSHARRGLILVTGATGNGKSTTIAALLEYINQTRQVHIVTIEDPIEFLFMNRLSSIIQREVGTDTHSFQDAMVASLRQDPDIIMLGEVRDEVTANVCLKAAETGHMVITTLHTPGVVSSVERFVSFLGEGDKRANYNRLAESLQTVVSLRLVKGKTASGLVPAVEIMRVTHSLQECVRNPEKHSEILGHVEKGREIYGMQTFDQHLIDMIRAETITMEAAKLAATSPSAIERALLVS